MDHKTYEFGGKSFYQAKASAWQKMKIFALLSGKPVAGMDQFSLLNALGDNILEFYRMTLTPLGMEKADWIKALMTPGMLDHSVLFASEISEADTLEILADFLDLTLEPCELEKSAKHQGRIVKALAHVHEAQNESLMNSSPSSPEETPVNGGLSMPSPMMN